MAEGNPEKVGIFSRLETIHLKREKAKHKPDKAVKRGFTAFLLTVSLAIFLSGESHSLTTRTIATIVSKQQQSDHDRPLETASTDPQAQHWQPEATATFPHLQLWPAQGFNRRYIHWLTDFQALQQLASDLHQLPALGGPIMLQFSDCEKLTLRYQPQSRELSLCYRLLSYLEDQFDDLSASPRERQLAVLDALYFLVARQFSQIILEHSGVPLTERSRDELTAVLPVILQQRSPGIVLSGVQWIFNQGHPLGLPDTLAKHQGEPLTLETYGRLICTTYGIEPNHYPYLAVEIPQREALNTCEGQAAGLIQQWEQRLGLTP